LKPILQQFGNFFLEWNERWSVFVAFDKLTLDQKIVKKELEKSLHSAGLQVETMYEYIDNEAANAVHSNLEQSFNSLDI
jgi:predicted nuclease with TOPRIM domain